MRFVRQFFHRFFEQLQIALHLVAVAHDFRRVTVVNQRRVTDPIFEAPFRAAHFDAAENLFMHAADVKQPGRVAEHATRPDHPALLLVLHHEHDHVRADSRRRAGRKCGRDVAARIAGRTRGERRGAQENGGDGPAGLQPHGPTLAARAYSYLANYAQEAHTWDQITAQSPTAVGYKCLALSAYAAKNTGLAQLAQNKLLSKVPKSQRKTLTAELESASTQPKSAQGC